MKSFLDSNFLLQSETAQKLYHEHAAKMPIIDYHCHLIPQQIADNYQFADLTEIWLVVTILNGVRCVPTAYLKHTSQGINQRMKNLKNGLKPCSMPCATLYITGPILN